MHSRDQIDLIRVATMEDSANAESTDDQKKLPTCLIMLGMAGSGKTSFVQVIVKQSFHKQFLFHFLSNLLFFSCLKRLTTNLIAEKRHPYVINLDPACYDLPYPCNIGRSLIIL